ncbi:hypothetical protein AHAS_Ahas11G0321400 [Arachis hypogaea]
MVFQFLVFPFTALSFFFCCCFLLQCDSDSSTWSYINDHVHFQFHIGQWYASLGMYDVAVKHMMKILACSHQSKATHELFLSDFLQTVKDPSMSSMLESLTSPSNKDQLEERMARIKEDPSLKHILDEIETSGPAAMMRFRWQN